MKEKKHECERFPKGYTRLVIKFFKEAIDGWNWNLMVQDNEDPKTWDCYHIKYCPFCGLPLE